MKAKPLVALMDEFHCIASQTPVEDAPARIVRHAGIAASGSMALEALARLLTMEVARRRHAEARCAELSLRAEAGEGSDA